MADIQYLGHACFRLRGRDGTVLCDPYSHTVGQPGQPGQSIGRPTAHIVTVSHDHPGHNNIAAVGPMRDEELFVIDGPGEYEVKGVLIDGIRTYHDKDKGNSHGFNTVYLIRLDDILFCHLGDVGHELTQTQLEAIGNVDVLFIPVGGGRSITPAEAVGVIGQLEPRMVIPMHYALDTPETRDAPETSQQEDSHSLAPITAFAHEVGLKEYTAQERVTITSSSLPSENDETRIVVMQPTHG